MKLSPLSRTWIFAAGLAVPTAMTTAGAASLYWDGSSKGPGADGGAGTWSANPNTLNWSTSPSGGTNAPWTFGSSAVFAGTGGLVTVSGNMSAASLSFQTAGYRLSGGSLTLTAVSLPPFIDVGTNEVVLESYIQGTSDIAKKGTGTLTLSAANNFSRIFLITEGTVKAGDKSSFGSTQSGTVIFAGATLDLNGKDIDQEVLTVAGHGVGGAGAIVSNSTGNIRAPHIRISGATTFGVSTRWDIADDREFQMSGATLTKKGSGEIHLRGQIDSPGKIDVKEGGLWLDLGQTLKGSDSNTITIRNGALLGQISDHHDTPQEWAVLLEGKTTWRTAGSPSRWDGPVKILGNTTLDVPSGADLIHYGRIFGEGSITKNGGGIWTLNPDSNYTGGTTVNEGKMVIASMKNSGRFVYLRGKITVNDGATLVIATPGAFGEDDYEPLNIIGGLVDHTSGGSSSLRILNLTGGTLGSGDGVNLPDSGSVFSLSDGSRINSLSSATPSWIRARLDLSGGTAVGAVFHVEDGGTTEDLRMDAPLTESGAGHPITKSGAGVMILNGRGLHTGTTTIEEGTLLLASLGSLEGSPVKVRTGARFGTTGSGKNLPALTADAGSTLVLPAKPGTSTTVTGTLDLTGGGITISPVLGAGVVAGTYDLVSAGNITDSGIPQLDLAGAFGSTRATGSLAINGNKLQLILSQTGGNLAWTNASAGGAAVGTWDASLFNFSLDGNLTAFRAYDSVTFDDSVAPGEDKTIALGATLAPALLTVDNSNGAYTFNSGGSLTGAGSLVKTGTSSLTIGGTDSHSMTGDVTAGGGILDFSGKSISGGHLTIRNGGRLDNARAEFNTVDLQSGSASAVLTGTSSWTKTTAGTVRLTADNQLVGGGTIAEGSLLIGNTTSPGNTGSLGGGPVHIAAGASLTFSRGDNPQIKNRFSGEGTLNLAGNYDGASATSLFSLLPDNNGFSGPMTLANARLAVTGDKQLGSGGLTFIGRTLFDIKDTVISNTLHTSVAGGGGGENPAPGYSEIFLQNAEIAGPVYLAGGSTTKFVGVKPYPIFSDPVVTNVISGPIHEIGGPASLALDCRFQSHVLTISGNSTYTGETIIHPDTWVNLTGSLGATAVKVMWTATLGGNGVIGTGGSLAFEENSIFRANLSGSGFTVNGDLDLGPGNVLVDVDLALAGNTGGPVPILNYTGTLTGTTEQMVMKDPALHRQAVFSSLPGQITLDIGKKQLIWKGESGDGWENGGAKRWNTTGIGETESFYKGDGVLFNDTGSDHVTSTGPVEPSSVVFNNNGKNYTVTAVIDGAGTLTKRGGGDLNLSAFSNYSGGTVIEAGRVDAHMTALGTGPVSLSATATLTGSVEIRGKTTIHGTIDPGLSGQDAPAAISTGSAVLTGTYACQLDNNSSDLLAVTGDLDITGAKLELNKTFSNPNPEFFTIATYTGTLTGRFETVTGMPGGFTLLYDIPGKRILVAPITFTQWAEEYAGLSDKASDADPDGDGIPNLIEFVMGGNPTSADPTLLKAPELVGENLLFRYKRTDASIYSTQQTVQFSYDFDNWVNIPVTAVGEWNVEVSDNGDLPDDITVTIPQGTDKTFVRLKVAAP